MPRRRPSRKEGAFTLLEMAITLTLVGMALIPLYKWQSFVLLSLRLQDDSIEILTDVRNTLRFFERDVASATRVVFKKADSAQGGPGGFSTETALVLDHSLPGGLTGGTTESFRITYGLGNGTHFSPEGTCLMRVTRIVGGTPFIGTPSIGSTTQTLARHAKQLRFDYETPGRVGIALESGIDFGEHSQSQSVRSAAALMGTER
jgi:type II secretory pathway pseudopilin PulG